MVIENFSPGVMHRLSLSAEAVRAANPRCIYVSMPGFRSTDRTKAELKAFEAIIMTECELSPAAGMRGRGGSARVLARASSEHAPTHCRHAVCAQARRTGRACGPGSCFGNPRPRALTCMRCPAAWPGLQTPRAGPCRAPIAPLRRCAASRTPPPALRGGAASSLHPAPRHAPCPPPTWRLISCRSPLGLSARCFLQPPWSQCAMLSAAPCL